MSVEPRVIRIINRNRRRALLCKLAVVFFAVLSVVVVLWLVFPGGNKHELVVFSHLYKVLSVVLVFGLSGLLWVFFAVMDSIAYKRFLSNSTAPTNNYGRELHRFKDAIDSACLATGVKRPGLAVLCLPGINAVMFETAEGKLTFGVTADTLSAHLAEEEPEAIVFHEFSRYIEGVYVRRPYPLEIRYLPFIALPIVLFFGIYAALVHNAGTAWVWLSIVFNPAVTVGCSLIALFALDRVEQYGDLLADALAAKLTSNPQAVRSTLRKAADSSELQEQGKSASVKDPWALGRLTSRFFCSPPIRDLNIEGEDVRTRSVIRQLELRDDNLQAIERGDWKILSA